MEAGATKRRVEMVINDTEISNKSFVDAFIAGVVEGLVSRLEGYGSFKKVQINIVKDDIKVAFDGSAVECNGFVGDIIRRTLVGMAEPLGVAGLVKNINIQVAGSEV